MHSIARSFGNRERQAMHSIARSFGEWQRFALPFSLSDTRQPEYFLKFAGSVGRWLRHRVTTVKECDSLVHLDERNDLYRWRMQRQSGARRVGGHSYQWQPAQGNLGRRSRNDE